MSSILPCSDSRAISSSHLQHEWKIGLPWANTRGILTNSPCYDSQKYSPKSQIGLVLFSGFQNISEPLLKKIKKTTVCDILSNYATENNFYQRMEIFFLPHANLARCLASETGCGWASGRKNMFVCLRDFCAGWKTARHLFTIHVL